jgi:hypothetical protein
MRLQRKACPYISGRPALVKEANGSETFEKNGPDESDPLKAQADEMRKQPF